jgi:hypothetical protein
MKPLIQSKKLVQSFFYDDLLLAYISNYFSDNETSIELLKRFYKELLQVIDRDNDYT